MLGAAGVLGGGGGGPVLDDGVGLCGHRGTDVFAGAASALPHRMSMRFAV